MLYLLSDGSYVTGGVSESTTLLQRTLVVEGEEHLREAVEHFAKHKGIDERMIVVNELNVSCRWSPWQGEDV